MSVAIISSNIVPVITVRHIRGKAAEQTQTKQVAVQILGAKHKITTARYRFEFIQMEAVGDRVRPITLKVSLCDGDEEISSPTSMTFDSTSEKMDDRKKSVTVLLKDRAYDKKAVYRLVLRDAETGVEQQSVDVTIDRAFDDVF